jgi:vancomycin permeability regulator SanA
MFVGVFFLGIVNLGNIVGVIFSTVGFGMFAFNNKYSQLIDALNSKPIGRGVVNVVSWVLVAYILLATFITGCMVFKINNHPTEPSNIIVLGCKVKGTRPSLMLKRRLDTAYDYLIANPNVLAIVSGGKGSDEQISEAQCMRDYLVSKGIPESRIVMEDSSTSTYENFKYSKDILEERGLPTDSITVVTDGYHQLRASMIAKQLDFKTYSISAKTSWYLVPTYFIREWFGVVYQTVTIINN